MSLQELSRSVENWTVWTSVIHKVLGLTQWHIIHTALCVKVQLSVLVRIALPAVTYKP